MAAPTDRVVLDPHKLRGLAHPLRLRILDELRIDGPSTASRLATRLGESSGATSYHLRQLEAYGFVVEDTERERTGRERWWRSAARMTEVPRTTMREGGADAEGFLRALANDNYAHMEAFVDHLPDLPPAWDEGWTMSDRMLRVTPAEAKRLRRDLAKLVERYRQDDPDADDHGPAGAEQVIVQLQVLPRLARWLTP